jgi:hypothetical protein
MIESGKWMPRLWIAALISEGLAIIALVGVLMGLMLD